MKSFEIMLTTTNWELKMIFMVAKYGYYSLKIIFRRKKKNQN